jgi:N-acetylglucosamine-6-sulfatase
MRLVERAPVDPPRLILSSIAAAGNVKRPVIPPAGRSLVTPSATAGLPRPFMPGPLNLVARLCALGAAAFLPCSTQAAAPGVRPNIVFVLVDDLRFDELGCTGHPFVKTPNIDRLAREGAMFRNAFVTTPLCSPSRASFLTGLYAHGHGIVDNTDRSPRSHQLDTFARRLHDAGYETAYIGKWHMGNDDSRRPGFDYWVSMKGQGEANDPELNENDRTTRVRGYITDILTSRAVEFLKQPRGKPFLLYLAHKALHPNLLQHADGSVVAIGEGGFIPAERHRHLYRDEPLPRRPNYGKAPLAKPALQRRIGDLPPLGPGTATDDTTIRDRLRMLMAVEEGFGRLLNALQRTGTLDKTMVVFTGDHGYFYGEHGLSVERRLAYEETIRIPLLMRYPPLIKPGMVFDQMVLSLDLAPTFLELGQAAMPRRLHGRSLAPLLRGGPWTPRTSFLIEYYSDTVFPRVHRMGYQAVRTERWKYIRYAELEGMDEAYDLRNDPYELRNLIGEPDAQAEVSRLRSELDRLLESTQ